VTTPLLPNKSLAAVRPYASAVVSLGKRLGVPVVDLYSNLQAIPSWQNTLFADGLHFTPEGSRAVWKEVLGVLQQELPQVRYVVARGGGRRMEGGGLGHERAGQSGGRYWL
jgi:lysophospholipase L1-like esterase